MSGSDSPDYDSPQSPEGGGMGEAVAEAFAAMVHALVQLVLFLTFVLLQAMRLLFLVLPYAIRGACVIAPLAGGALLFPELASAYQNDLPANLLALTIVVAIPGALLLAGVNWGSLLLAGLIDLGLRLALPHAPPAVLGFAPGALLAAAIVWHLFSLSRVEEDPVPKETEEESHESEG